MRELGPLGSALVICLRSHCYHDRVKGELRDRVKIAVPDVAAEIGVSAKTVRRELETIAEAGAPLARFLRVHIVYTPGRTPESVRRDANMYQVAMDDPVHPLDEPALLAAVRAKEARAEKGGGGESEQEAKERARREGRQGHDGGGQRSPQKPPGQNDQATLGGLVNLAPPLDNLALGPPKMTRGSGQNDQALSDSSSILLNPLNPLPKSLPPAVSEERKERAERITLAAAFAALAPAQQRVHLDRAEQELIALHAGMGITPKSKLIEQRALNLYAAALKETQ